MYPEITARLRKIDEILNGQNFYHIDQRLEEILLQLKGGMEFLAKKIESLENKPRDPHGYIPGSDD